MFDVHFKSQHQSVFVLLPISSPVDFHESQSGSSEAERVAIGNEFNQTLPALGSSDHLHVFGESNTERKREGKISFIFWEIRFFGGKNTTGIDFGVPVPHYLCCFSPVEPYSS